MKENEETTHSNSNEPERTTIDIEDIIVLINKTESEKDRGGSE